MTTPDDPNRVLIFDTTLRDGEQSPGISLNPPEKLEIAQQLARLGVDVIEAGFPIASPGDFEAVQTIARTVDGPVIAGAGPHPVADIDAAWNAIKDAARPRIHTFISTSDIHIVHQLQTTREDVKGQARAAVAHARALLRGRRVLPDGRDARRRRVHRRGAAGRDRRGRDARSTSPTPSATRSRTSTPRSSRGLYELVPDLQRRRALGPLPRRPGPGRRQLAGRDPRPGRARWSARSTASASAPATPRWRRSSCCCTRARPTSASHRRGHPRRSPGPRGWSRA